MKMKGKALPTIAPNLRAATMTADLVTRTKVVFDTKYFFCPSGQEHLMPCIFLTLHLCIKFFFLSIHCLNVTTWVMCQHCMELDQQLPSFITLLTFAFDYISSKERIMFRLFQDLTEHFMTGAGCPKSSARHRAISSNEPLPQSNLAHCPFLWPASDRLTAHAFCETNLTLPRPLFFTLVSSSLSFHSWIISFIPVINFQVFLFFVFSLLSVFQEHQRKLKFCPVWRLLSPFSVHSFSSPSTYYRLLYCVPSTITCIR